MLLSYKVFSLRTLVCLLLFVPSSTLAQPRVDGQYLIKFSNNQTQSSVSQAQAQLGLQLLENNDRSGSVLMQTVDGEDLDSKSIKDLVASGVVEYIEPNYIVSINQQLPNDTLFTQLWGLHNNAQTGGSNNIDIDAPEAWGITTGSSNVVVGVVDTGVNYLHPDLIANIWHNPLEIPNNNVDDDLNGVIDDVHGYNALENNGNPLDDNGHGSHCAGTIAAVGDNSIGVVGTSWNTKILPLKFLDSSGFGSIQDAIKAIEYAIDLKRRGVNIKVLSNSWGGSGYSQALEDTVAAAEAEGILFVAAAGNSSNDNDFVPTYPANFDLGSVLSVAALDHHGNLASFSNYGPTTVHLAAPGVNILSTHLGANYETFSGTSMATPHVSGVAALLASTEPSLSAALVHDRIVSTIKPLAGLNGLLRSPGIVSAINALTNARAPLPPPEEQPRYSYRSTEFAFDGDFGTKIITEDDAYYTISLPFAFSFYQQDIDRLSISSNGRIVPLPIGRAAPDQADFANQPMEGIAVYHDDLIPSTVSGGDEGVWARVDGDQIVVTWIMVHYADRNEADQATEIRVQAVLFSDGRIHYRYLDTEAGDPALNNGASATVGTHPPAGILGKKLVVSHNGTNTFLLQNNSALELTQQVGPGVLLDYDADGLRDLFVWRPSLGMWYVGLSSSDYDPYSPATHQLGLPGDNPLLGDFDGDSRPDFSVWRPLNGTWYFKLSSTSYQEITEVQWGLPIDTPLVGDFDGDSIYDLAINRPDPGAFYVLLSSAGFDNSAAFAGDMRAMLNISSGGDGFDHLAADFTGDGRDNFVSVWQPLRFWTVKDAANQLISSEPWGYPGDTPLACDLNANGISGRTVVRVNESYTLDWYTVEDDGAVRIDNFGSISDQPKCIDFDKDGVDDLTVFRWYTGEWFIRLSTTGEVRYHQFGLSGDIAP